MGDGEVEIVVHNAYFAPKRQNPCCKPKVPKGPDMPEIDGPDMPDVPKPDMPDMPKVDMPNIPKPDMPDVPKPDMPDVPKVDMPDLPKAPKMPCKKPKKEDKYTCTVKTGGVMGVGGDSKTSDEFVDSGNYISLRAFRNNFDFDKDDKTKKFKVEIHKKSGNPLIPAKELCEVEFEPDLTRYGRGERIPIKSKNFGPQSYVYCSFYVRRRPS